MNTHTGYDQAAQRVNEKVGFYTHLAVYVAVNGLLTIIDFATASDVLWFYWPLVGWGIGLALHAWKVFSSPAVSRMKQRMIQRELQREEELPAK